MIQSIYIRNFQTHSKLDLDLHHGVNAIVGPSDAGKSAVIRALYWLCFNEPSGEEYRKHGTEQTTVKVVLADGTEVERGRGKKNYYRVNGEKFEGFGRKVPQEVTNALNIPSSNFARQMDPPFLLSESPTQVAKRLNDIANLDKIEPTIKAASKLVYTYRQEMRNADEMLEGLYEEQYRFEKLDTLHKLMEQAYKNEKQMLSAKNRHASITRALSNIDNAREEYDKHKAKYPQKLSHVIQQGLAIYNRMLDTANKKQAIASLLNIVQSSERLIKEEEELIQGFKKDFEENIGNHPCPLCHRKP